jgi:2-polyprenyl-3-methyl-5-hydroxy-6-metoxy-1,4-benzoquinol methylase
MQRREESSGEQAAVMETSELGKSPCSYCGGQSHSRLFDGAYPNIVRCSSCGLIFNAVMPGERELARIYSEGYYRSKDSLERGYSNYLEDRSNIAKTATKRIRDIEKVKASGSLLDVGCAFGFFLDVAGKRGWTVAGVEISQFAAKYAVRELHLNVIDHNIESWECPAGSYDVITMWDLLEHLRDPLGTLRKLASALKEDGIVVLSTPDVDSLPAKVMGEKWLGWQLQNEHLYYFSSATLERMLQSAGLVVIKRMHIGKHVPFELFVDRLALYSQPAATMVAYLKKLFPRPLDFYVNPLDIMCVYARRGGGEDVS